MFISRLKDFATVSLLLTVLTCGARAVHAGDGADMEITELIQQPDGKRIVSASWDGTARIWRTPR